MRAHFATIVLSSALACAGPGAASLHRATASAPPAEEGMTLSHSEPDAPRCFTTREKRLICPEGGAAIYSASDAAMLNNTLPSMEMDPNCVGAGSGKQCTVVPAVAEDAPQE